MIWRGLAVPIAVISLIFVPALAGASDNPSVTAPCPALEIRGGAIKPGLSDEETRLVCGDPQGPEGWKKVPLSQARFNLKNFLQQRGYHHPAFRVEGERNIVDIGTPTIVASLKADGAPESLHIERRRKVVGEIMTPALLSDAEKWVNGRLQSLGYPCPQIHAEGNPDTGEIVVHVQPGPLQNLVTIAEEAIPGLAQGVIRRYDAFNLGERFNGDWLAVTENRVTADRFVMNTHFTAACGPDGAVARQENVPGAPRLITVGFGVNTEGIIQIKTSWRNMRIGNWGTTADISVLASSIEQTVTGTVNWFWKHEPSRQALRPMIMVRHNNEVYYEIGQTEGQFAWATSMETFHNALNFLAGPTLDYFRTFRGYGPSSSHFFSLGAELDWLTHDYELYRGSPRQGFSTRLTAYFSDRRVFAEASAQRLKWSGEYLWNIHEFDPPLWVMGFRWGAAATLTGERPGPGTNLPPVFFQYLGGSTDLRGFGRQELPSDGAGGLTSIFASGEARLGSVLPLRLEPFLFLDTGAIGKEPLRLDAPFYLSPGVGIRYPSPIGVFRTTIAHGYPESAPGHWQFFLSYGEEF